MSNSTKTGDPITNLTGRQMVPAAAEPISASGLAHYVARQVGGLRVISTLAVPSGRR